MHWLPHHMEAWASERRKCNARITRVSCLLYCCCWFKQTGCTGYKKVFQFQSNNLPQCADTRLLISCSFHAKANFAWLKTIQHGFMCLPSCRLRHQYTQGITCATSTSKVVRATWGKVLMAWGAYFDILWHLNHKISRLLTLFVVHKSYSWSLFRSKMHDSFNEVKSLDHAEIQNRIERCLKLTQTIVHVLHSIHRKLPEVGKILLSFIILICHMLPGGPVPSQIDLPMKLWWKLPKWRPSLPPNSALLCSTQAGS